MATRTLTAMFSSKAEAERAGQMLVSELGLQQAMIRTSPGEGVLDTGYDKSRPYEEMGFFGSLKDLFVPDEDRYAYAEGMRRGAVLLSVQVDDAQVNQASDIVEHAGAVDLDQQEANWKQSGWTGYDATAHTSARPAMAAGAASATMPRTGQDDTIKVMEERLAIGKRAVEGGRVKVRSYVVERPVEAQVRLHEETVHVERHAVNRPVTAADTGAFQEKTLEAHATSEEAVVGKEARIVEEISIHKDATDHTETVRDTVHKTQVDVEEVPGTARTTGTTSVTGGTGTRAGQTAQSAATGAAGTVDKALGTNMSGTNPAASAPDGAPGNPKGTMASRAVDKTLGTNISGANPGNKT